VKLTVTFELFQPLAFGVGVGVAVMTGGVLSTFNLTDAELVFPVLSTTVPAIVPRSDCATAYPHNMRIRHPTKSFDTVFVIDRACLDHQ
jgi:hypothetical protein